MPGNMKQENNTSGAAVKRKKARHAGNKMILKHIFSP